MDIKKLLIRLIRNTAIVIGLFWIIFVLPSANLDIFNADTFIETDDTMTVESGDLYVNGEIVNESYKNSTYVFTEKELKESYGRAIADVIDYSNDVNIVGDATVYLKYLQNKEEIVCVYSDIYRFEALGLNETNIVVEALNRILNINIVLEPASKYTEDKGLVTIKELIDSGVADIGVYPQFSYQNDILIDDVSYKISEPYSIKRMYALSLGDDTEVDLAVDKVAIIDTAEDYNPKFLGGSAIIATKEEAVQLLENDVVDHIIESSSSDLEYYTKNGLYMNIVKEEKFTGLNYLFAKEEYAKELIAIMDKMLSKESLSAIAEFGDKKYNYTAIDYLNRTKGVVNYDELSDGYLDLAFCEHVGLISYDEITGIDGYSLDVLKYLSKALEIKFRLHDYTDLGYNTMVADLNNNVVDGILNSAMPTSVNDTYNLNGSTNTIPYLYSRFDLQMKVGTKSISTLEDLNFKSIGVTKNDVDAVEEFLRYKLKDNGSIHLSVYDDYEQLSRALKREEVEYVMTYPGFTKFMQDKEQLWCVNAYNENTFRGFNSNDFFIEFNAKDTSKQELITLLNRGISSISLDELKTRWFYTGSIFDSVIQQDMKKNTLNILILVVIAVILISAITTLIQQDRTDKYLRDILLVDNITGFGNRYAYNQSIETDESLYCIKTRIPNFKFKVSSMSDNEVEKLYKTIANRISEYNKDYESVKHFHFSEDEFIILMPYADDLEINEYIEGLLSVLKAVYVIKDKQIEIKMQIVALLNELIYYDNSKLIMYCSSILDSNGNAERNSATVLTSGMLQRLKKVEILDELLSRDLEEIIVPYYAPIISVETKEVIGLEMIGRMNTRNISLSRKEYIEHATESGLSGELQKILLDKMLEDRKYLIEAGVINEKFLFSFYAGEELMTKYGDDIISRFNEEGIYELNFLQLLVPETELSKPSVVEKVKSAQSAKIKVVVDNFNVGHSSLGKIIALKLDGVKLLHHFIDDNGKSFETSLFESLIKMVSEIDVPINVSDIENTRDYHYVLSNNVQYLQGSYFVRPLPINHIKKYLEQGHLDFESLDIL